MQGGAPKPPPCSMGTGAEPTSPRSRSSGETLARIQPAEGWSRFPKGAKALWSMGVQGERDSSTLFDGSRGAPKAPLVMGCRGAGTRPDAWRTTEPVTVPRHAPEGMQRGTRERVPLAKIVRGQTKFYFVCTTRTHLANRVKWGLPKPELSFRLRRPGPCSPRAVKASRARRFSLTLVSSMALAVCPLLRRKRSCAGGKQFRLCWQRQEKSRTVRQEENARRKGADSYWRSGREKGPNGPKRFAGREPRSLAVRGFMAARPFRE